MRYLVLSDIHGNLEALEAALSAATARGYDQLLVLGDLVVVASNERRGPQVPQAIDDAVRIRAVADEIAEHQQLVVAA